MQRYKRFQHQPGTYFGNDDEKDGGVLLGEERQSEQRGWDAGWERIHAALRTSRPVPPMPQPEPVALDLDAVASDAQAQPRKKAQRETQDTPETDATRYMLALPAEELVMPVMPGRKDMEAFLLQSKKAALRREYGVH